MLVWDDFHLRHGEGVEVLKDWKFEVEECKKCSDTTA
jgi:hypothetical protein